MLKDIEPGSHTINVSHPCYLSGAQADLVVSGDNMQEQDFLLEAAGMGTIHGAVHNIFTGKPIEAVVVSTGYGPLSKTDPEGFYTLDLPLCKTDITIAAFGYLPFIRKNISPAADVSLELNAALIPWPFHLFMSQEPDTIND
jgi:hypothetical protein